jgi:hypothetical protein
MDFIVMVSQKNFYKKKPANWRVLKIVVFPLLLIFSLLTAGSPLPAQATGTWNKIIRGQEYRSPLVLDEGDDNTLIVGAVFHDFTGDAITLGNVSNVYIKNCEIYGIDGNGIVFRSTKKTDRVTIDGCVIHDTTRNGIIAKQNIPEGGIHTQLVIKNNRLYDNGTDELDHGMYIQSQDTKIENNDISGSTGNGISIRSSGIISGNKITDTQKSCIRYFSDNVRGPSNTLLIENNICQLSLPGAQSSAFSLLLADNTPPGWIVENFIIRFNTIAVFTGKRAGIAIESPELKLQNIQVYGNIVINTEDLQGTIQNENIDYFSSNYMSTQFQGFENIKHPPYDLHLTPWSPAIDFADRESNFPVYDADGQPRNPDHLDAGAYQLTRNASTYALQSLTYIIEALTLGGVLFLAIKGIQRLRQQKSS